MHECGEDVGKHRSIFFFLREMASMDTCGWSSTIIQRAGKGWDGASVDCIISLNKPQAFCILVEAVVTRRTSTG